MSVLKLLFILSADHGELANATSLASGGTFTSKILMPANLFEVHGKELNCESSPYTGFDNLVARIADESPDATFLFSGYLFAINALFSIDNVEQLIGRLLESNKPMATSDPFLGLVRCVGSSTFSRSHPAKAQLTEHFSRVSRLLENLPHYYPIAPEHPSPRDLWSFSKRLPRYEVDRRRRPLVVHSIK